MRTQGDLRGKKSSQSWLQAAKIACYCGYQHTAVGELFFETERKGKFKRYHVGTIERHVPDDFIPLSDISYLVVD